MSRPTKGPFCPSAAEIELYWEKHGEELKPSPDCPDPDPLPDSTDPEPIGEPVVEPTTLAEAQQVYDPHNDPLILVREKATGTYTSITMSVLDQAYIPPASVQTSEQYEAWLAAQPPQQP